MKNNKLICTFIAILALSCNSGAQNSAIKTMNAIQDAKAKYSPGMVPTNANEYTMKAKINGKEWVADAMYPPSVANRIAGSKGEEHISMPYWSLKYQVGQIRKFDENHAVDIFMNDDVGLWGAYNGQSEITKVGDKWAEGTFYFTAVSQQDAGKVLKVTDGFFRIPIDQ